MDLIIKPTSPMSETAPFAELLDRESDMNTVLQTFVNALAKSFQRDAKRNGKGFAQKIMTIHEEKRRSQILFKWFRVLRKDCGLSLQNTLNEIPKALMNELDGISYKPPAKSRIWVPQGA
jgi:hypothetical protein